VGTRIVEGTSKSDEMLIKAIAGSAEVDSHQNFVDDAAEEKIMTSIQRLSLEKPGTSSPLCLP
jgi:hypothetical protein